MAMIAADTDVLIDFLAGQIPAGDRVELELKRGQLVTTAVTRFELLCGTQSKRQLKLIQELLEALPTLSFDEAAANQAAELRNWLQKKGQDIGMGDSLIAGIVISHGAMLLTRNRRHFERIPELQLASISHTPSTASAQ
ncbi:type II toxin-antitoxin system VapC family toxin [Acidobacteria bacterium AH-259-D05]|nr:type II toxin-antitoxin system VapC family toxin [Acidobacteria bacterium AH-259-D05]